MFHLAADSFQAEKIIYDHLAQNTRYGSSPDIEEANYNIIGPLLYGSAVCEGYAKAFKYLCDAIKLPCIVVSGSAINPQENNEPHSWNIVRVNGDYYHTDVTWDSILSNDEENEYDYFNLTDEEMKNDHSWNTRLLPKCDTNFTKIAYVAKKIELVNLVLDSINQNRMYLSVRFKIPPPNEGSIINTVSKIIDKAPIALQRKVSAIEVRYNKAQNKAVIHFK